MRNQIQSKSTQNRRLFGLFACATIFVVGAYFTLLEQSINATDVQAEVKAAATIDLCSEGIPSNTLNTQAANIYTTDDVVISGCTFTINQDLGAPTTPYTFNSLTIGDGIGSNDSILNHSATTTSQVYRLNITTTGAFSILSDASIDLDARGFTSGYTYDAGSPDVPTTTGGSTVITGGAHRGKGGQGSGTAGSVFDSLFEPQQPGGGVGSWYPGSGGGAVKISANSLLLDGDITANGIANTTNGDTGSAGGSIWLVISGNITGSGSVSAIGGLSDSTTVNYASGAGGSVAVEYGGTSSLLIGSVSIQGGSKTGGNDINRGASGTVYFEDSTHVNEEGNLRLDNNSISTSQATPLSGSATLTNITIEGAALTTDSTITSIANLDADTSAVASFFGTPLAVSGDVTISNSAELNVRTMNVTGNVTVSSGANLSHPTTTTSTVYRLILTADEVTVNTGAFVNTDARGFTSGYTYDAGSPDVPTTTGGSTVITGGAHRGQGGRGSGTAGSVFDSLFEPQQPGGGVGSQYPGSGGGAVKISANSLLLDGDVTANGIANTTNGDTGSAGGSIWLVISGNITGSGSVSAIGGLSDSTAVNYASGAGGSVAVEYGGTSSLLIGSASIQGGSKTGGNDINRGASGTVYFEDSTHANEEGNLRLDNGSVVTSNTTSIASTLFDNVIIDNEAIVEFTGVPFNVAGDLDIDNSANLTAQTVVVTGDTTISNSAVLTHPPTTSGQVYRLNLTTAGLVIGSGASIDVDARGFTSGYTYDSGSPDVPTTTGGSTVITGGAHRGQGGRGSGTAGSVFDSLFEPQQPGGGVGSWYPGSGGGAVKISANSLLLDGDITANGIANTTNGDTGSAGGSIWLVISGNITGSGSVSAIGGLSDSTAASYASGAGGSVAVEYGGTSSLLIGSVSIQGGSKTGGNDINRGASGTVYFEDSTHVNEEGNLRLDNNSNSSAQNTPLIISGGPVAYTFNNFSILNLARLSIDQPPCLTGLALTVNGVQDYSGGGSVIDNNAGNCTETYLPQLISPTTLTGGVQTVAYSDTIWTGGGVAPKTIICLDGLGGSPATCNNASAGLPNGLTMDAAGVVSGTPTVVGTFNFVIKVTDSAGAPAVDEATMEITIGVVPNIPTIVSPSNLSTTADLGPELSANYSDNDAGDVGTTEYRVSSGSAADCFSNTSVVSSGSSATTSTNSEATTFIVTPDLSDLTTYEWCARNNDGVAQSAWTTMGTFDTDITYVPGGGFAQQQQQQQEQEEQEEQEDEVTIPATPGLGAVEVLGSNEVRYNWTDLSADEDGFRLLDNAGGIIIDNISAGITRASEGNLPHNTLTNIRNVAAYNSAGQSPSTENYPQAITAMPNVTAGVFFMGDTGVRVGIEESLNNLAIGQSGVEFELMLFETTLNAAALISSGWVQEEVFVFTGIDSGRGGEVRARARNQVGLMTGWSQFAGFEEMIPIEEVVEEELVEEVPEEVEVIEEKLPVEPPTEEEIVVIEELLTELFEEEVAEILGEEEGESESEIETTSSYDGESFTIEVTKEQEGEIEETLTITGFASPGEELIEFSGSTSEPNSVVTLIFNGNVTIVVVSDADGHWATYVSAEQLGIEPGQEANVSIEAIAAKGDLRSDRVQVGSMTISRSSEGEIEASFLTVVSQSAVVTAINEMAQEVAIIIEEQEEEIQTTLTVAAPVVIASSAPLWGYLPYLPTLIYHFFTYLVGFIGRRKQKGERLYGVAYDAITKEPLGLAIIRVYQTAGHGARGAGNEGDTPNPETRNPKPEKLIATKVTDKHGRYDFLLEPGEYRFEIKKPGYTFPSAIVTGQIDGDFKNIYDVKAKYVVSETETITIPDVPLDPENAEKKFEIAGGIKKAWLTLQKAGSHLAVPILIVGSIISVLVVMTIPENPVNWILAVFYIFMLILQLKLRPKISKAWGVVYDVATNAVLPLTTMQLIEPEFGKVVKSRLSDYQGRFNFMPEPGKYVIKANKEGYEQTEVVEGQKDRKPISGEVSIEKQDQAITGDVAMRAHSELE